MKLECAKNVNAHQDSIDYLGAHYGVRVHQISCIPLVFDASTGVWTEYVGHHYSIPMEESHLEESGVLKHAVEHYENCVNEDFDPQDKTELRNLILGLSDFKSAIKYPLARDLSS